MQKIFGKLIRQNTLAGLNHVELTLLGENPINGYPQAQKNYPINTKLKDYKTNNLIPAPVISKIAPIVWPILRPRLSKI